MLNGIAIGVVFPLLFPIPSHLTKQWQEGLQLDYTADETNSYIVDIILYNMKTKHLTGTFSMGLIVLISNAGLAFAVILTPQYNTMQATRQHAMIQNTCSYGIMTVPFGMALTKNTELFRTIHNGCRATGMVQYATINIRPSSMQGLLLAAMINKLVC